MSLELNDNLISIHGKPLSEIERKFINGTYQDYTSTLDITDTIPMPIRANKYFWVNGILYFTPDGTTFNIVKGFTNVVQDLSNPNATDIPSTEAVATPFTNDYFDI